MRGAKMGYLDYISRNTFAKARKILSCDEHFIVAVKTKVNSGIPSKTLLKTVRQHNINQKAF